MYIYADAAAAGVSDSTISPCVISLHQQMLYNTLNFNNPSKSSAAVKLLCAMAHTGNFEQVISFLSSFYELGLVHSENLIKGIIRAATDHLISISSTLSDPSLSSSSSPSSSSSSSFSSINSTHNSNDVDNPAEYKDQPDLSISEQANVLIRLLVRDCSTPLSKQLLSTLLRFHIVQADVEQVVWIITQLHQAGILPNPDWLAGR